MASTLQGADAADLGSSENPIDLTGNEAAADAQLEGSDLTDLSCMLSPRDIQGGPLPTATPQVLPALVTSSLPRKSCARL